MQLTSTSTASWSSNSFLICCCFKVLSCVLLLVSLVQGSFFAPSSYRPFGAHPYLQRMPPPRRNPLFEFGVVLPPSIVVSWKHPRPQQRLSFFTASSTFSAFTSFPTPTKFISLLQHCPQQQSFCHRHHHQRHHVYDNSYFRTISTTTTTTTTRRMTPSQQYAIPFRRGTLLDAMDAESHRRLSNVTTTTTTKEGDMSQTTQYTEYETWVRRLYMTNLFHPAKLDLRNMERLYDLMGRPLDQADISVIHVAGTNGKGSVSLKIAKTLELSDPTTKVGLFCSPHVSSFRERMQVNGELIQEQEVVQYLPHLYQLCEDHDIPATFFEITTALAFQFYAQRGVRYVVLEAGLGGRLDATNVIANPALAIITSIGLEHTKILGDTIEKIALEKGGIIKSGRPILVGPKVPIDVLRECAIDKGASVFYTCDDVLHDTGSDESTTTDYDVENSRIAKAALTLLQDMKFLTNPLSPEILHRGTSYRPPCRFEIIQGLDSGPEIVLDVAHNPPAMEYLVRKLHSTYPTKSKFRLVIGMSSDKDLTLNSKLALEAVGNDPTCIHLVEAAHPRAAKLEQILSEAKPMITSHYNFEDRSVEYQMKLAIQLAKEQNEILVVCGSIFVMAAAREALGMDEPRDSEYIAQVAGAGFRHGQENFANQNMADDQVATSTKSASNPTSITNR